MASGLSGSYISNIQQINNNVLNELKPSGASGVGTSNQAGGSWKTLASATLEVSSASNKVLAIASTVIKGYNASDNSQFNILESGGADSAAFYHKHTLAAVDYVPITFMKVLTPSGAGSLTFNFRWYGSAGAMSSMGNSYPDALSLLEISV